jgi:glutathione S-transferase
LDPGGEGIVAGRLSIADLALASVFVNLRHGGESLDAARWPKLAGHLEGVFARPSYVRLLDQEFAREKGAS